MQQSLNKSEEEEELDCLSQAPSQKDLKDYSNKLQEEFLQSDRVIKIHQTMNIPKDHKKSFVASNTLKEPLNLAKLNLSQKPFIDS
mmetsp:Transcript_16078/g.27144  ORF Transcript_16078/g.27144 Transcript_16078/m.27144 type:complete len:86 (+) Transcript_16078:874-1131(+)